MPQRLAENRTQIKNRTLVRMGHNSIYQGLKYLHRYVAKCATKKIVCNHDFFLVHFLFSCDSVRQDIFSNWVKHTFYRKAYRKNRKCNRGNMWSQSKSCENLEMSVIFLKLAKIWRRTV